MGLGLNPNGTKTLKTYDKVGRLDKVLHMNPGGTALWSETSRYDQRDRRTARIHHDGKADLFSYDPAGQVTAAAYGQSALIFPQDPKADSVQPLAVTRWDQTFAYDPAGNRSHFTEAPVGSAEPDAIRQWNYQANAANQYTAVKETTSTEPSTIEPRYDPNGNLLTDDRNTYTWDADIHLLSVTTKPSEVRAPGSRQLETLNQKPVTSEFRYDPLHRRVARLEPDGTLTHFIHDGWNVIAEYATPPNHKSQIVNHKLPSARRTWGHDISGKPQGAGGIGGLLASVHFQPSSTTVSNSKPSQTFCLNYDSNGNVVLLTDLKGQESARYSYDAFGQTLLANGAMAQKNKYRFSTKPVEIASGLCFYGYRYYSPELGRWLNRDPIGERGGLNLYGMLKNNSIRYTDRLGLICEAEAAALSAAEQAAGDAEAAHDTCLRELATQGDRVNTARLASIGAVGLEVATAENACSCTFGNVRKSDISNAWKAFAGAWLTGELCRQTLNGEKEDLATKLAECKQLQEQAVRARQAASDADTAHCDCTNQPQAPLP